MCGFTGFLTPPTRDADFLVEIVRCMANTLRSRGPDDAGEWVDAEAGVGFGFRRLSIIDLSPAGHQPMHSVSGRFVIAFNGEVYNFEEIRHELSEQNLAPEFRGHSDTEVILAAIEAWGLTSALARFIGMFAFALWDRKERQLFLVRDRLGVKPLYYGWCGKTFLFGSELKALRAHPDFRTDIDRDAVALMMRHNYICAPYTVYRGIQKLIPGTILKLRDGTRTAELNPYWSARAVAEAGVANPFTGTIGEAEAQLDDLLRSSVKLRMIADVPLGVFLSGGIDSSTVVAMMQVQSSRPVKTFSIGFHEDAYNEARYAKEVARHLGTDHTELYVTPEEAQAVIPKLPTLYDEPFADASQIPTYLVSALARRQVTVSLSGDGGDELFGGYNRYLWASTIWRRIGWLPSIVRSGIAQSIMSVAPDGWDRFLDKALPSLSRFKRHRNLGDKLHKLADVLAAPSAEELYRQLASHWKKPEQVVIGASEHRTPLTDRAQWANVRDFTQWMMHLDLITYLPDDILTKVDRASMGVSLEAREPMLDHRLVEFAWRLPLRMKVRDGKGKYLLRRVLDRYVPEALIERPKMGFGVPIDHWLRGPLRGWAEELLSEKRLNDDGYFHAGPIRNAWREHLSGSRNWQYHLWNVLMFQAWLASTRSAPVAVAVS